MAESVRKIRLNFGLFSKEKHDSRVIRGPVTPSAGDNAVPDIGTVMKDGTVFAGTSPDTNKPMNAMPADAPLTMRFNDASIYAFQARREKHLSHDDWRVPTKAELNVLFNNRAAIGGFDISGSYPRVWYWSSSSSDSCSAWEQRFSDGFQVDFYKDGHASVRLVR